MEFRKSLSEILEQQIKLKYRNVKQFALKAEMPYMTVLSVIKRGVENTTVGTLQKICEALGITIADLYKKQALDTITHKITTMSPNEYSDDDMIDDLIDCRLVDIHKKRYTDEQLKDIAQNYRFILSDIWLPPPTKEDSEWLEKQNSDESYAWGEPEETQKRR